MRPDLTLTADSKQDGYAGGAIWRSWKSHVLDRVLEKHRECRNWHSGASRSAPTRPLNRPQAAASLEVLALPDQDMSQGASPPLARYDCEVFLEALP